MWENCENNYQKLINPEKYQAFILHCPANIPLSFASHPRFVCNEKGEISRWEVLFKANKDKEWGHLHLNSFSPFSGIEILPFSAKFHWRSNLLKQIEGTLAKRIIEFIKMSKDNYPHKRYSLIGTNSNTYAQWVLDHFVELDLKLPWNSFGKNAE